MQKASSLSLESIPVSFPVGREECGGAFLSGGCRGPSCSSAHANTSGLLLEGAATVLGGFNGIPHCREGIYVFLILESETWENPKCQQKGHF